MKVVALNCGRTAGSDAGIVSILGLMNQHVPNWDVAFLAELDVHGDGHRIGLQCEHSIRRHYPGLGSLAMATVIHQSIKHLVRGISTRGRCMAVHLDQRTAQANEVISLFVIGIHNSHGDAQVDTLADVAYVIRRRPRWSHVVIAGDLNIDQLPALDGDPFHDDESRDRHHCEERLRLECFADSLKLDIHLPESSDGMPGGPYAQHCLFAPISRIPSGLSAEFCLPSLVDYALASPNIIKCCYLSWEGVPADHAMLGVTLEVQVARRRSLKKTWQCKNEEGCIDWLRDNAPTSFVSLEDFHDFAKLAQVEFDDKLSCAQRRHLRLPQYLRSMYKQLSETSCEQTRLQLKRRAWDLRKKWVDTWKTQRLRESVAKGGVHVRSKKLHTLEVLVEGDANPCCDHRRWEEALGKYFGEKWGAKNRVGRRQLMQQLTEVGSGKVDITCAELGSAFRAIRRKKKMDDYGVSVGVLLFLWQAAPGIFVEFLRRFMSSTALMSSIDVAGRAFGKESSVSPVSKLRTILPLPAMLQVVDALLPILFESYCQLFCRQPQAAWSQAVPSLKYWTFPMVSISFLRRASMISARLQSPRAISSNFMILCQFC